MAYIPLEIEQQYMHVLDRLRGRFKTQVYTAWDLCWRDGVELQPFFGIRDPWTQARMWRRSRSSTRVDSQLAKMRDGENGLYLPWLADVLEEVGPQPDGVYETETTWATNAVPGLSWHQWGQACDFFLRNPDGSANWDSSEWGYRWMARTMILHGLCSGFFWKSPDPAHVQRDSRRVLDIKAVSEIDLQMRDLWSPGAGLEHEAAVRNYGLDVERERG